MKPYIYPYNIGSKSARGLAQGLGTIQVREKGTFVPGPQKLVVNWGNGRKPKWAHNKVYLMLNDYSDIQVAQNKLTTFKAFAKAGVACVDWTDNKEDAKGWLNEGGVVVCRKLLGSHSGNGIVLASKNGELVPAPLYTKYKKKAQEFRVHVFNGKVIDVQEKRRANGAKDQEGYDQYIRSHYNGWIYCREDIAEPKALRKLAVDAVKSVGLDFGAVDIIFNKHENQCYCLEINTAPGLEGTTLQNYIKAIKEYVQIH